MTELVVFLNINTASPTVPAAIQTYIDGIAPLFYKTILACTDRYHLTAEESALAAAAYATGEFLWLVGDKRIFLPEGLAQFDAFVTNPGAPCAYFNSVWYDSDANTNGLSSTHLVSARTRTSYKQFVMRCGINFMATAMGAWVFERRLLDLAVWRQVIDQCGPHFSHVTALLLGLREGEVQCHSTFLIQAEAKAYHAGDASEWMLYAQLSGTYQFYAWTFGLVRQFRLLIEQGVYCYADVRRSMCSQDRILRRQVDEIYIQLLSQLRQGRTVPKERIKAAEFDELMDFLSRACPEKAIVHQMFRSFYEGTESDSNKVFQDKWAKLNHAILIDQLELWLSSLIVGQIGASYVRLHPGGYVISKVRDNSNFLLAYKLLDPPPSSNHWRILGEEELAALATAGPPPRSMSDIFTVAARKPSVSASFLRGSTRRAVIFLHRNPLIFRLVSLLPEPIKQRVRSVLF
jgi:hypothetical protein